MCADGDIRREGRKNSTSSCSTPTTARSNPGQQKVAQTRCEPTSRILSQGAHLLPAASILLPSAHLHSRRVQKLLAYVNSTLKWRLMDRPALDSWVHPKGRIVLLGDACHPMLVRLAHLLRLLSLIMLHVAISRPRCCDGDRGRGRARRAALASVDDRRATSAAQGVSGSTVRHRLC